MSKQIFHIMLLSLGIFISFSISKINLYAYDIPIALGLFIVLFLIKVIVLPSGEIWNLIESFIFTVITVFTVLTTGGITSPFFFLIFFLVFSLSLLLEPIVSLATTLIMILLFVLTTRPDMPFKSLLPIFSLAFLCPFALILAQERVENEKLKLQDQSLRENTFLFLSLTLKKHLKSILDILENFNAEKDMTSLKKQAKMITKLIEKYDTSSLSNDE